MVGLISLLVIVALSMLITRVATIALTHTGLSRESARFQARSALTGAGFTTTESEKVVNHPVRRRIVMILMLVGNAGIVTGMASLMLTFVHGSGGGWLSWTPSLGQSTAKPKWKAAGFMPPVEAVDYQSKPDRVSVDQAPDVYVSHCKRRNTGAVTAEPGCRRRRL